MNELFQEIRSYRWVDILKNLPFQSGPSSTRWVYLASCAVICGGWLLIVIAFVTLLFLRKMNDTVTATVAGLIVSLGGLVVGFTTRSQNLKHTLQSAGYMSALNKGEEVNKNG